jgi:7-cyano-7-deazaguanine synthase
MDKAVILLSGGMDSTTLLHHVKRRLGVRDIRALSFLYGQKHSREIEMAAWQARAAEVTEHRIVDISFFGELVAGGSALTDGRLAVPDLAEIATERRRQPPTYVPHRNMLLLSMGAAYAESNGVADVFYGAQAQDQYGYWDCTADFLERMNRVLALNRGRPVMIHAPFLGWRKADELRLGLELGVDYSRTWTCYRGGEAPCGRCPSCSERAAAFWEVGIDDPLTLR